MKSFKIILLLLSCTLLSISCAANRNIAGSYSYFIPNPQTWLPISSEKLPKEQFSFNEKGIEIELVKAYQLNPDGAVLFISSLKLPKESTREVLASYITRLTGKWTSEKIKQDVYMSGSMEVHQLVINNDGQLIIKLLLTSSRIDDGIVIDVLTDPENYDIVLTTITSLTSNIRIIPQKN